MTIQEVKKELGIKNKDIAVFFKYSSTSSYATAARKEKLDNGIIEIYLRCKEHFETKTNRIWKGIIYPNKTILQNN